MSPFTTKKYKKRAAHAAAMGRMNKKNSNINNVVTQVLTVSPDLVDKTNINNKNDLNTLPLTNEIKKTNKCCREAEKLNKGPRERNDYIKRDSGNRIIHWDSLQDMICTNSVCRQCGSNVYLDEFTTGLATQVRLTCQNKNCTMEVANKVKKTVCTKNKFSPKDPVEMFAINCQFVLCLLQTGSGSTEAEIIMNYLDLPNSTFKKKIICKDSRCDSSGNHQIIRYVNGKGKN